MSPQVALTICIASMLPMRVAADPDSTNLADPELNFEHLWTSLDRTYAQFEPKHVDWDALYRVYRPRVTAETEDEELFEIMMAMLGHLCDAHVCVDPGGRRTCVGIVDQMTMDDFSLELVTDAYLGGEALSSLGGRFTSGWLNDSIGYLHIRDFKYGSTEAGAAIDDFLQEFHTADGLIIDVRDNTGGHGPNGEVVAARFADRRRHYKTSWVRYGESHNDFDDPQYWRVEPDGPIQYTGPTILLTHRFTESAAENFTLAMRVLPHVTVVGDLTAGACSSQFPDKLPNGWTFWVAFKVSRDHDGVCWDGIGIPPDLRVRNTKAHLDGGVDHVLEFAMRLLEDGDLQPRERSSSLDQVELSLIEQYLKAVGEGGLEAGRAVLAEARASSDDEVVLSVDEVVSLFGDYVRGEALHEIVPLIEFCKEKYPQVASLYGMLALAYLNAGDIPAARAILAEGESVEPMLPWEAPMLERVRRSVEDQ